MSDVGKKLVGGRTELDGVLDDLAHSTPSTARPGFVSSPRGTTPKLTLEDRIEKGYINADAGSPLPTDVDGLFGATKAYINYKSEKPVHRLILWYKLQGYDNKEVSKLLGYSYHTICQVVKQVWFQEAFCQLSAEMGKDACETFLQGEVLPALQRTADIARNGESEAVRLAANKEILDRFLGKSTVKIEAKSTVDVTNTTIDAAKLLEEQRRLDEQIRANGLNLHGPS